MLQIFGTDISSPSNKVRFVANACGVPYDYRPVDLRKKDQKSPEFMAMNPVGKVPAINDDGFNLFESNAIARYLAQKNKPELYPSETKKRAVVDQWMDFISLHIGVAMGKVFYNKVLFKMIGESVDERSLKDGTNWLSQYLPVLDQQLKKNRFIAGDEMSIADLNLVATLDPIDVVEFDLTPYPSLKKWREGMMSQKFYKDCHTSYGAVLQAMM